MAGIDSGVAAHLALARPKVVAALTRQFRSLENAEEAFQEACVRALVRWPDSGVPRDPTAWLLVAGRNATLDRLRKDRRLVFDDGLAEAEVSGDDAEQDIAEQIDMAELRDDVLRLLFMCCHPDLSLQDQLALALKVIAGFSVEKIARALVVRPKSMEQRITRAKKKASAMAVRLETPSLQERTARLDAVCTMIYLLFNEGYSAGGGDVHIRGELCDEAIRLLRLLLNLFPAQSEVMGLLALCLIQHSRRDARLGPDGDLVPLESQDRRKWHRAEISEGQVLLEKALRRGRPGPYQIQAAIAATHGRARRADETDWPEIERLYEALEHVQPTAVVSLNRAVAVSKIQGASAALDHLDRLSGDLGNYLYFHTTRASFLMETDRPDLAVVAFRQALSLGPTGQETEHIQQQIALCEARQK
ncbi:MAG: RNA polymerase sigma factor [Alphaproteobacteria bacterium]|nr:RNA polymerase sigma factor [Alphaproteobacteria bacterium]